MSKGKIFQSIAKRKRKNTPTNVARKLESRSMIDTPNYPGMRDVETGKAGKVTVGESSYLQDISAKSARKNKSIKDATAAEKKTMEEIKNIQQQIKNNTADKSKPIKERAVIGKGLQSKLESKKDLLQQAQDKKRSASRKYGGKVVKNKKAYGGKVMKKNMGGSVRKRVGMASKMTSRKAGGPVRQRYAMATGKK